MQIHNLPKTNPQYEINKAEFNQLIKPKTVKPDDKNKGIRIYPYLSVSLCDNLIMQNVLLNKCLETYTEDVILNPISLQDKDHPRNDDIIKFWELNQNELKKQVLDYFSYGFGGSEILYDNNTGEPANIVQIPADTLYISKETKHNEFGERTDYYYAVQSVIGQEDVKMRIFNRDYPIEDEELPVCFWLGGGRKSDFYDYPIWISAFNNISASVSLDLLNAQKIADGNLISGILTVIKPPGLNNEENVEDTLEEKMQQKGSGVFTLELTTLNPNIPLTVDYIQISESNYDYLNELARISDEKILAVFKIPKARLLIDDTTESMNSNKTNTLYQIYTVELQNTQKIIELELNQFNNILFDFDNKLDIKTPVFINEEDVQVETIIKLFNTGLISLGQAVTKVVQIYPEFEDTLNIDETNPLFDERYFNGNPLGFSDNNLNNPVTDIGDFIDYFKIT